MRGELITAALLAALLAAAQPAAAGGDVAEGRAIAQAHCSRCHVVDDNRYAGINSTPSFHLLAKRDDWLERFGSFFARRPHPVFVRVPGVEKPTDLPSPVAEFTVTPEGIEHILSYVETLRAAE